MGILAAAVGSTFAARLLLALVHYLGGPTVLPLGSSFVLLDHLPSTAVATMRCVLVLFGADIFGRPVGLETAAAFTHLLGLAFVLGTVWLVLSRWCHDHEHDRVTQILVMTILVDVAAYLFSEHLIDLGTSRYLVPTLVCGAILGGRGGCGVVACARLAAASIGGSRDLLRSVLLERHDRGSIIRGA
jgi:hypothetical protein